MQQISSWTETLRREICCILIVLLYFLLVSCTYSVVEGVLYFAADELVKSKNLFLKQLLSTPRRGPKLATSHHNLRTETFSPDAVLVFDTLLARGVAVRDNPNQISSLFLHFAALISVDASGPPGAIGVDKTGRRKLRLSPLYGKTSAEEARVRTYNNGLLKDDAFTSSEVLLFPLGVRVLLIMFNRFHNYVASGLLAINESCQFSKPLTSLEKDEAIYQMARRITCRLYINIILNDYLRTLLGLNKSDAPWILQPETQLRDLPVKMGKWASFRTHQTHQVANSFIADNWWKSALSEEDNDFLSRGFPDQPSMSDATSSSHDDDGMARDLASAIEDIASALGANRVPVTFRSLQIQSITQARDQQLPTLNEYRRSVGLPVHRKFEDINSSLLVQSKLRVLYANPDEVELHPGVVAEQPRPGIMCATAVAEKGQWTGSTVTHALLCDTVALIRGDPFYTEEEWSPESVTNWGFHESASDKNVNYGCVMHKLVLRAFPKHFAADSVFAHFPFVTPQGNRAILAELGADPYYSFEAAHGDTSGPDGPSLTSIPRDAHVTGRPMNFSKPHWPTINMLQQIKNSPTGAESEPIKTDLVENVIVPYFVEAFCSRFSLTMSSNNYDGLLTTAQVWQAMRSIHEPTCNLDSVNSMKLQRKSHLAAEQIRLQIVKEKKARRRRSWRDTILGKWQDSQDVDHSMCSAIKQTAHRLVNVQQILVESFEYFLTGGKDSAVGLQHLSTKMKKSHPSCFRNVTHRVLHYLLEGYRLFLAIDGRSFWRKSSHLGARLSNVSSVARNNGIYQNATVLALDRNLKSYEMIGVEKSMLDLLGTQSILALFSDLATSFAGWDVVGDCQGLPRRINIPRHYWGDGGTEEPTQGTGNVHQGEEDWRLVHGLEAMQDDSWVVVSNEEESVSGGDVREPWEPELSGEATVYPTREGGELSSMPDCLEVVWNPGSKR